MPSVFLQGVLPSSDALTPTLALHKAGDPFSNHQLSRFKRWVHSTHCCGTQARNDHGPTADAP